MADWYRVVTKQFGGRRTSVVFAETAEHAMDTALRLSNGTVAGTGTIKVTPVTLSVAGEMVTFGVPRCTWCNKPGGRIAIYDMAVNKMEHLCKTCTDAL